MLGPHFTFGSPGGEPRAGTEVFAEANGLKGWGVNGRFLYCT